LRAYDAAAAMRVVASLYDGLAVGISPGVGWAGGRQPLHGAFAVVSAHVGVRAPAETTHPYAYGPRDWLFAFDVGLYASLRHDFGRDVQVLSLGFESAPTALGATVFALTE
jgi:hypothetical protein